LLSGTDDVPELSHELLTELLGEGTPPLPPGEWSK
jgi:hypothetical protein